MYPGGWLTAGPPCDNLMSRIGLDARKDRLHCERSTRYVVISRETLHARRYTLDRRTQVLGNVKGVVAVVASILWFRNPVNVASMMGYAITVSGVVAYSQARRADASSLYLLIVPPLTASCSGRPGTVFCTVIEHMPLHRRPRPCHARIG